MVGKLYSDFVPHILWQVSEFIQRQSHLNTFILQEQDKKIVQRWRSKRWPDDHYSSVTIEIDQKQDHTELILSQTSVPKR